MFNHGGDELDFEGGLLVVFEGRLDDAVDMVTVVNSAIHVTNESSINSILCHGEMMEDANPDVVVPEPQEEFNILLHHAERHGTRHLDVKYDSVLLLGVIVVFNMKHFFHTLLGFFFIVGDLIHLGDHAGHRAICSWKVGSTFWCLSRTSMRRALRWRGDLSLAAVVIYNIFGPELLNAVVLSLVYMRGDVGGLGSPCTRDGQGVGGGSYCHHCEEHYGHSLEAKATWEELVLFYVRVTREHVLTRSTNCCNVRTSFH
jgi:hypothetical protein